METDRLLLARPHFENFRGTLASLQPLETIYLANLKMDFRYLVLDSNTFVLSVFLAKVLSVKSSNLVTLLLDNHGILSIYARIKRSIITNIYLFSNTWSYHA